MLRVWEYIWVELVDPVDESIDKQELMRSKAGEKLIKESIKSQFGYFLCCSGLIQKAPKDIYEWWVRTATPCMLQSKHEGAYHDRCWEKFFNKIIAGFVPTVIKGGSNKFGNQEEV
ncbi:hypothetical protein [Cellulosilyticum sp. I15G10I2]|uniref:hypothetical protein n=1 Tax=Cellulosilyticum sp. I15G10I2 TaxID=1892843 RepID=UPI00085C6D57|nr:hypothetical protein [Cellulosilyticum sp. I15G10I2]